MVLVEGVDETSDPYSIAICDWFEGLPSKKVVRISIVTLALLTTLIADVSDSQERTVLERNMGRVLREISDPLPFDRAAANEWAGLYNQFLADSSPDTKEEEAMAATLLKKQIISTAISSGLTLVEHPKHYHQTLIKDWNLSVFHPYQD